MEQEDLTYQIIGAAYRVYKTLGFGFLESVYKKAMVIELGKKGLAFEEEKPLKVFYEGKIVGDFFIDLLVNNEVIVELKSIQTFFLPFFRKGRKTKIILLILSENL